MSLLKHLPLAVPLLALLGAACGDPGEATGSGGASPGVAGSGPAPTAGAPAATGGAPAATGGAPVVVNLAGSGQALGGGDQGSLFDVTGAVPIMPVEMGGSGGSGGGSSGIPGDGNVFTSKIGGSINGTAVFTQKGEDVTVVVTLNSGCANGNHQFRIHDGFSCDNDTTEGVPWTPRGVGIGPAEGIACSNGKGSLTYTRSGADKTKNLTVGSHVLETDITSHVVIVSDEKDPNSRAGCGNFF